MMWSKQATAGAIMIAGAAALATGCVSETTGAEGNLEFRYSTTDDLNNFNKPIAVGAKLELRVYDAGTGSDRDAPVTEVTSSDPEVLSVEPGGGNTVIVEAVGEGSAEIQVTAEVDGAEEFDRITMRGAAPEVFKTSHLCREGSARRAAYLTQQDIFIPFDLELEDGQSVIGYGYYPVMFDPAEAIMLDADVRDQDFLHLTTSDQIGVVTMSTSVDGTELELELVEEGAIDDAQLADEDPAGVGQTELYQLLPSTAGSPICQARAEFTVSSTSPDICDVSKLAEDSQSETDLGELTRRPGWIEVEGKAVGTCTFEVTFPNGAEGAGVTTELSVSVQNQ